MLPRAARACLQDSAPVRRRRYALPWLGPNSLAHRPQLPVPCMALGNTSSSYQGAVSTKETESSSRAVHRRVVGLVCRQVSGRTGGAGAALTRSGVAARPAGPPACRRASPGPPGCCRRSTRCRTSPAGRGSDDRRRAGKWVASRQGRAWQWAACSGGALQARPLYLPLTAAQGARCTPRPRAAPCRRAAARGGGPWAGAAWRR